MSLSSIAAPLEQLPLCPPSRLLRNPPSLHQPRHTTSLSAPPRRCRPQLRRSQPYAGKLGPEARPGSGISRRRAAVLHRPHSGRLVQFHGQQIVGVVASEVFIRVQSVTRPEARPGYQGKWMEVKIPDLKLEERRSIPVHKRVSHVCSE